MTFSMVTTAMSFCLILIVVGAYAYYKRKMKAINYGLVALSDKY
jgi:cbb3-type cytochrome oxidase subunit 3